MRFYFFGPYWSATNTRIKGGRAVDVSKSVCGANESVSDLEGRGIKPRDPASALHSVQDQFEYEFSDRKFCLTD